MIGPLWPRLEPTRHKEAAIARAASETSPRLALFLAVLAGLLLLESRSGPANDGAAIAAVAQSLVSHGAPVYPGYVPGYSLRGPDGETYSKYSLGMSLALVPATWAARVMELGDSDRDLIRLSVVFMLRFVPALLGALTVLFLFDLGGPLGFTRREAAAGALLALLATPAWVYTRRFYPDVLLMAAITGGFVAAVRAEQRQWLRDGAAAGFAAGLAWLAKPVGPLVLAALGAWLLAAAVRTRRVRPLLGFGLGALLPVLVVLWYASLRTGHLFGSGYGEGVDRFGFSTPLHVGLYGLLLSPGKGALWYAPAALLGVWAWRRRGSPLARLALAALSAAFLLVSARWWAWHGAECWGPRLLVPVLPLLAFPVGRLLVGPPGWGRRLARGAVGVGLAVQLLGVTISWDEHYRRVPYQTWGQQLARLGPDAPIEALDAGNLDAVHFDPRYSPIVGHAWLASQLLVSSSQLGTAPWGMAPRAPEIDYGVDWWVLEARGTQATGFAALLAALLALMVGLYSVRLWRGLRTVAPP